MACYNPIRAWRKARVDSETGKRGITFSRSQGNQDMELSIPCGKCIGCRIGKSVEWALRCVHESQMYERNCFITLTYDEDNVPRSGTLVKKHFQDFLKRLRKSVEPKQIRYFMCGEYGEQLGRPHYHAIIFNHDFEDKEVFKYADKSILYTSKKLQDLWPYGFSTVGEANYTTAAYCARYTLKKIFGEKADEHYQGREPEYCQMSLRPGLGKEYVIKYYNELKQHDSIVMNGREYPLPKYYSYLFEELEREELIKRRKRHINPDEQTTERLRVRELVHTKELKHKGVL